MVTIQSSPINFPLEFIFTVDSNFFFLHKPFNYLPFIKDFFSIKAIFDESKILIRPWCR